MTFLSTAKAAAQLVAKQAERTKLATITLPAAYRLLGQHCYKSPEFRVELPDLFRQLDQLREKLAAFASNQANQPVAQTLADKAKAAANKAMQTAQAQKLSVQKSLLLSNLGKAIYERHRESSGPEAVIEPIRTTLDRIAHLDVEIAELGAPKKGAWITPKRLMVATIIVVAIGSLTALRESRQRTPDAAAGSPASHQPNDVPTAGAPTPAHTNRNDTDGDVAQLRGDTASTPPPYSDDNEPPADFRNHQPWPTLALAQMATQLNESNSPPGRRQDIYFSPKGGYSGLLLKI